LQRRFIKTANVMDHRAVPYAKVMRPLSDPGVVRRIAPFVATYCVGVALALFEPASSLKVLPLIAAAVLTAVLSAAALCLPWERLPAWTEATPVLASFAIIALLRHAEGGANLGYAALVMLPVIWMGIYATRAQLGFAIAGRRPHSSCRSSWWDHRSIPTAICAARFSGLRAGC
jgi:hypothetical protein